MSSVRGYRPALDGVRALAIAGVMAEHLHLSHAPAGALGVDIFFVLSGYLITGLLARENETTGRLDLRAFYIRRALRLYPALLIVLVVGGLVVVADLHKPSHQVAIGGVLAALYLTDIATFTHTSAWAAWGFTWSLAIEEHFYLLWPALMGWLTARRMSSRAIALTAAVIALSVGEATARAGAGGPSLAYFQPQTHAFGLLIGCALALSCPPAWTRRLGVPCLAGLLILMAVGPPATSVLFIRLGVPVACLLTLGLLAALEHQPRVGELLAWTPLRRVGVISYGLYLYHLVVFNVVSAHLHASRYVLMVVQVVAAIVIAEISYRWYEEPLRSLGRRRRRSGTELEHGEPAVASAS